VSGGQRQKGAKMNAVILFSFLSFFFFVEGDIFAKIKHTKLTYYSTFISRTRSTNIQNQQFFRETDVVNSSSFFFLYFSSLGFSFGLF